MSISTFLISEVAGSRTGSGPRNLGRSGVPTSAALLQVVLPDKKDDKKDVVVFLSSADAADTEEEAQQLGALAALHRVAGERALHRILPSSYLPAWQKCGQEVRPLHCAPLLGSAVQNRPLASAVRSPGWGQT